MDILLNLITVNLEQGFMYALLALGVYITYSILDFPDLSVDGTVPLGAVISAVLILKGFNPWLATIAAFAAGAIAGCVTGLLHVKLKIRPLLCGILVMTALLSINLVIIKAGTGGMSVASLFNSKVITNAAPASFISSNIGGRNLRTLIVMITIAIIVKLLLDLYFKTKSGMLLRATGSNQQYVTMLARNPGNSKILGLALGNGFAAMAGAVIAQTSGSASLQLGTGMVVIGLASVIIGTSLFRKFKFLKPTTKVIFGTIIYKACLSVAERIGLSDWLKFIMAVLCVIALVAGSALDKGKAVSGND
ncbi:MAG: ABC transporter permease [Oscillospiraceae bacterium]|nr:ABC transporter permease [Oscillospiraceae bacterium]